MLRPESVPPLADLIKEYVSYDDLSALCDLFEIQPPRDGVLINYIALARELARSGVPPALPGRQ